MRLGLRGVVRRVWAPRGVTVRQAVELTYDWTYLALAVDGTRGRLWWTWQPSMKKGAVAQSLQTFHAAGVEAVVWDGAASHRARMVRDLGVPLIRLPTAAPELNPAERVIEELRRAVEGRLYGTLDRKVAVVERELRALAADPARVQSLTGWSWLRTALADLPPSFPAPSG
jgi:transposase